MNPIPIIAFMAGAGIVTSFGAFIWACMTRQFTGYDLGKLPLESYEHTDEVAADASPAADHRSVLSRRVGAAILAGALVMVFGLIGWSIYLVIAVANGSATL